MVVTDATIVMSATVTTDTTKATKEKRCNKCNSNLVIPRLQSDIPLITGLSTSGATVATNETRAIVPTGMTNVTGVMMLPSVASGTTVELLITKC